MKNKAILIVDDDERIVRMFKRRLKKITHCRKREIGTGNSNQVTA